MVEKTAQGQRERRMKQKLTSLRFRILLPVIAMTLVVVTQLTGLFSRAYIQMILKQENEESTATLDTITHSITTLISNSINEVRAGMADERVVSYMNLAYTTEAELIHARINFRDFLLSEIARYEGIYGLLFMRENGSMFGVLPERYFFQDRPEENSLPEAMKAQILQLQLGETAWFGPFSGAEIYGFENDRTPDNIMIAAWKSVDVSYGECYAMMLMDESVFTRQFAALKNGKSEWHFFTADQDEFYYTGQEACPDPGWLISESNSGTIIRDINDHPFCIYAKEMTSPDWTLVQEVSMENYEQVVRRVRRTVWITASLIFLVALLLYELWLRRFMRQFNSLLKGIIRMGKGDLKSTDFEASSINEFKTMQKEINLTSLALQEQMETIRRMEKEQMEQESRRKEQELMIRELQMAREIQGGVLPHIFPPFPDRKEIDLFASMDPARDVGGDFYDFYFIDEDHLCLLIADVSGKGIPAALFMMVAKRILEDSARLEYSVSEILEKTNGALCDNNHAEMFVTVWLGILEISTGRLTAANAGHEYPVIRKKGSSFELYKDKHGFVIGGMKGIHYREYQIRLNPGDKIFIYTDGVPEATAGNGEMFGTERMVAALNTCGESCPEEILKGVRKAVDSFVGDAEQFDDLTMLCLEYKGS